MEKITLTARARTGSGKSYTRKARSAGWIPAAFYGFGVDPLNIEIDAREFIQMKARKQLNKLVELKGEGIPTNVLAVIRDFQKDAVTNDLYYHIDFQSVDTSRPVKTRAFVDLVGTSEAVKLGGILNQVVYEVDIEGLVDDIPERVTADISPLDQSGAVMAGAIDLGDKVKLLTSPARVIARLLGRAKG